MSDPISNVGKGRPWPYANTMAPRPLGPNEGVLLGDNRNASADRHVWGPVLADRLMGHILYRVRPWDRAGGL